MSLGWLPISEKELLKTAQELIKLEKSLLFGPTLTLILLIFGEHKKSNLHILKKVGLSTFKEVLETYVYYSTAMLFNIPLFCLKGYSETLLLGEGWTNGINGSFGSPEKKCSFYFTKANTKFCLSLHYNYNNSYLSLKLIITMLIFHASFIQEAYPMDLELVILSEVSLKRNVYDFSVDYSAIDIFDIFNIHKYITAKNIYVILNNYIFVNVLAY